MAMSVIGARNSFQKVKNIKKHTGNKNKVKNTIKNLKT